MTGSTFNRRRALTGSLSVGLALPILAACGGEDASSAPRASEPADSTDPESTDPEPTDPEPSTDGALASTADVPVGGGLIIADQAVVITQPTEGDFRGFSATCTHSGCLVNEISETIDCPCHGSTFSLETGEPTGGPAASPLGEMPLQVRNGQISLA